MPPPAASAPAARPILVAEDNVSVREALRDVLLLEGYDVAEAENGRVALQRLFTPPAPCLVILDLLMPVMTGSEFLWAGRSFARRMGIPILLLSAVTGQSWASRQADRALAKPIDVDVLLSTIAELCH
jgi:CheY-like chemotaxis protein